MISYPHQRLHWTPLWLRRSCDDRVDAFQGGPELAARLGREGYAQLAEELGYDYKEEHNLMTSDLMLS